LQNFLTLHNCKWSEDDFKGLLKELSHRGYGWLRSAGVKKKLEEIQKEIANYNND